MKLDAMLLRHAAAEKDKELILRIFYCNAPELYYIKNDLFYTKPSEWSFWKTLYTAKDEMSVETPRGSLHYRKGQFLLGEHRSNFMIVYHPEFCMDVAQ